VIAQPIPRPPPVTRTSLFEKSSVKGIIETLNVEATDVDGEVNRTHNKPFVRTLSMGRPYLKTVNRMIQA
jgi:hypothetical protein